MGHRDNELFLRATFTYPSWPMISDPHFRKRLFHISTFLIAALGLGHVMIVAWLIIGAQTDALIQFIPDDTFYYLTLSRAFATTQQWTFDAGTSVTSGFHLLHGYVLAAIYSIFKPTDELFIRQAIGLSVLLALPAIMGGGVLSLKSRNLCPALFLVALLLSRNISLCLISGVEWSWVISTAALYAFLFWRAGRTDKPLALPIFLAGLMGSLARSDFGLWPAALLAAVFLSPPRHAFRRRMAAIAFVGLLGAVAGIAVLLVHNRVLTGDYLQSSARMKALWLVSDGKSFMPILRHAGMMLNKTTLLSKAISAAALLIPLAIGARTFLRRYHHDSVSDLLGPDHILWMASVMAVAGYFLFYSCNAAVQPWYTANIVVPLVFTICLPLIKLNAMERQSFLATVCMSMLVIIQGLDAHRLFRAPPWPHQASMYHAGIYLRTVDMPEGKIGAWNAGIIGFFQGGHVVNLDGLVNNDIYDYVRCNKLEDYIENNNIRYLVEFSNMLQPPYPARGGYDNPAFLDRLKPLHVFDGFTRGSGWRNLTLYLVMPAGE